VIQYRCFFKYCAWMFAAIMLVVSPVLAQTPVTTVPPPDPPPTRQAPDEPGTTESGKTEPGKPEPGKTEQAPSAPGTTAPVTTAPGKPQQHGEALHPPDEPGTTETGKTEPGIPEPAATPPSANTTTQCVPTPPAAQCAPPQAKPPVESRVEIYGFVMTDFGYNIDQIDPNWFDTMRPTKLPAFKDEFGRNGSTWAGVRQTRTGIKGFFDTPLGEMTTLFEWELFGVGVDQGQTTFRLRHAYGQLGHFGAGQTWSPFMDIDVFPNSLEYWGPNGMVFFRNVQVRYMPVMGEHHELTIALERPGSTQDAGVFANRIEEQNVNGRFRFPDLSGDYKWSGKRGYLRGAAIVRNTHLDDVLPDAFNFDQSLTGWGINGSTNIKFGEKNVLKGEYVFGKGIENYMNDAPADIAPIPNPGNPVTPVKGENLPVRGIVAFYDHYWNDKWSSSIGYSQVRITNTSLQIPAEFHKGDYALANLLYYPTDGVMYGGEFQWGRRSNFADGFRVNDYKIQFSFRYNYDIKIPKIK
jgi:hypothetical protein